MSKNDPLRESAPEMLLWGEGSLLNINNIPGRIIVSGHKIR
jgi:hypothetical protein